MAEDAIPGSPVKAYKDIPPILQGDPFAQGDVDGQDFQRVEYVRKLWKSQDHLLRDRDRTIEQHIRMLCGQQWSVWSDLRGRWVDLTDYLDDDERRWRYLPVINRMLHWYMLLHARMTENPPILTFQAAGGDRIDAELAEVMDAVWKHLWYEVAGGERMDDLFAWLIPSGEAYMKSRIDPNKGDVIPFEGPASVQLRDPNTGGLMDQVVPNAPYDREGNPLVDEMGEFTGQPHVEYEGAIALDVLTPMQIRGTWGQVPWHEKPWHIQRSLLTPEEVYEQWGRDVEPNVKGSEAEEAGTMRRMLLGSGYFGAATGRANDHYGTNTGNQEYIEVFEGWFAPCRFPGMERTEEDPGGRLLITAGNERMRDGSRYANFKYTSPIRHFTFVNVKGRQAGTSPAEMMVGPQKSYNRIMSQILQHATVVANPLKVIDTSAGIQEDQITNRPGQNIFANLSGLTQAPIQYIDPPSLSRDVWRSNEQLRFEMNELGNVAGSEGTPPHMEASGELVKELRYNSDRFVGPTLRRAVQELTRLAEDWKVMLPLIWDVPKILRVVGEDNIATTLTVMPHVFEQGNMNVRPDVESMLPEGRGERQARVWRMWQDGAWGDPLMPEAREMYLSLANFPHMGRATMPGGMDRITAEQNVGKLIMGTSAQEIPIFEWYDHSIHLMFTERFMKSPEYLKQPPEIMQEFASHRQRLLMAVIIKAQQDAMMAVMAEGPAQQLMARTAMQTEGAAMDEAKAQGIPIEPGPPERGAPLTTHRRRAKVPETPEAPVVVGKTPPPQPEVEAPPTVAEAIAEVVAEAEERGHIVPEEGADAVPVGEAEALDVGEQAGDGDEVAGEGEDEEREVSPEEGEQAEETSEGEEEVDSDIFTVKLPVRRDGEAPVELDLEGLDEESKEGFRRLMNEGIRRDQLDSAMEQVRSVQAEIQDVMISMDADPINFIMERTTPELRADLARHLLSEPATYESVVPDVAGWDRSAEAREAAMARLERDRILASREAEGVIAMKAESRANAKDIHDHVVGLVPEGTSEHVQELFVDQAMRVIQQYATQHQINTLDINQVSPILSQTHVLRLLEAQGAVRPTPNPTDPSSAVPARPAATDKSLREAEETAERFVKPRPGNGALPQ